MGRRREGRGEWERRRRGRGRGSLEREKGAVGRVYRFTEHTHYKATAFERRSSLQIQNIG